MTGPTITDWIQAVTSLLALVLAVASLIWQWRSHQASRGPKLSVAVTERKPGVWSGKLTFGPVPTNHALKARVRVLQPKGVKLFDPGQLPYDYEQSDIIVSMPAPAWAKHVDIAVNQALEVNLAHRFDTLDVAEGAVGLGLPDGSASARIRVELIDPLRRRPLITRTTLISPIK